MFACLGAAGTANAGESGQRNFAQVSVEPAVDSANGNTVYLLTPLKAPFPSKANPVATAPLYLPLYPVTSKLSASDFNCQPGNCDHVNVLPFPSVGYGPLPGSDKACTDFNHGNPCSAVKGHDHLIGVANTKGDFNVAWHVKLVVFTHAAFLDGNIDVRIQTLSQLNELVKSGDAIIVDTPVTFNCSITSERTYELGTPVVIPYP
ncbi:MAG TPA: hypothetical protein VGK29_05990 [Paludibaculum sp.]|jgi:hypothetical protein